MKGLPWGEYYNAHQNDNLNAQDLERRIVELIADDEVDNKKGIYAFLLTGDERTLNLRTFDEKTKQMKYAEQQGVCPLCTGENNTKTWEISEMEADHITPWSKGGKTTAENCQMLCKDCNRRKSGK
jgi:5-methylcytosine-specific restriction endonuclease McrA